MSIISSKVCVHISATNVEVIDDTSTQIVKSVNIVLESGRCRAPATRIVLITSV